MEYGFTKEMRRFIAQARKKAGESGDRCIRARHLVLALLDSPYCPGGYILGRLVDRTLLLERCRSRAERPVWDYAGALPFSRQAGSIMRELLENAKHKAIGTVHLLMTLASQSAMLRKCGVTCDRVEAEATRPAESGGSELRDLMMAQPEIVRECLWAELEGFVEEFRVKPGFSPNPASGKEGRVSASG